MFSIFRPIKAAILTIAIRLNQRQVYVTAVMIMNPRIKLMYNCHEGEEKTSYLTVLTIAMHIYICIDFLVSFPILLALANSINTL